MDALSTDKAPRTERGRRTLRKLLEAAAQEFGDRGYHDAAITGITARAGVALGSFYTYFESKEEVYRALVKDMSQAVRSHVAEAVADEDRDDPALREVDGVAIDRPAAELRAGIGVGGDRVASVGAGDLADDERHRRLVAGGAREQRVGDAFRREELAAAEELALDSGGAGVGDQLDRDRLSPPRPSGAATLPR